MEVDIVLRTCFIQVSEVNTHSLFAIGLFYQDDVREPIRVLAFSNEIGFKELLDFGLCASTLSLP